MFGGPKLDANRVCDTVLQPSEHVVDDAGPVVNALAEAEDGDEAEDPAARPVRPATQQGSQAGREERRQGTAHLSTENM